MQGETTEYYHVLQHRQFIILAPRLTGYIFWGTSQQKSEEENVYFWCITTTRDYSIMQTECIVRPSDVSLNRNGLRCGEGKFVPLPNEVYIFLDNCFFRMKQN